MKAIRRQLKQEAKQKGVLKLMSKGSPYIRRPRPRNLSARFLQGPRSPSSIAHVNLDMDTGQEVKEENKHYEGLGISHHSKSGKPTPSPLPFMPRTALSFQSPVKQTSQPYMSCGKGSNRESIPSVTCPLRVQAPSKSLHQCLLRMICPHILSL